MSKSAMARRGIRHKDGRFKNLNPCYVCGKSAGDNYWSDHRTDTGEFGDIALCLCGDCAEKGEAMSDEEALKFYGNGARWKPYILLRDGKEVMRGYEDDCMKFIHKNHSYSFDHALKYEGYSIKKVWPR